MSINTNMNGTWGGMLSILYIGIKHSIFVKKINEEQYYRFIYIMNIVKCDLEGKDVYETLKFLKGHIQKKMSTSKTNKYENWKKNYLKNCSLDLNCSENINLKNSIYEISTNYKKLVSLKDYKKENKIESIKMFLLIEKIEKALKYNEDITLYSFSQSYFNKKITKIDENKSEKVKNNEAYNKFLNERKSKEYILNKNDINFILQEFPNIQEEEYYGIPAEILKTINFLSEKNNKEAKLGQYIKKIFELSIEKLIKNKKEDFIFNIFTGYKIENRSKAHTFKMFFEVLKSKKYTEKLIKQTKNKENILDLLFFFSKKSEIINESYEKITWLENYQDLSAMITYDMYCSFLSEEKFNKKMAA